MPITPAEIQAIAHRAVPLAGEWGIEVLEAGAGRALCLLPAAPRLLRPGGIVSGPAIMGFADVAFWAALLSLTEGRDESLTVSMSVNFLRAAGPGPLIAESRLIKPKGRLLFGEVLIRRKDEAAPIAQVTATWMAVQPPKT
ncbi:MAG: PaaI family thioesterase [Acetobacteraceae bacterium]|nr:PaaI family thioesterase [Acetobacteraceae bacterium]